MYLKGNIYGQNNFFKANDLQEVQCTHTVS